MTVSKRLHHQALTLLALLSALNCAMGCVAPHTATTKARSQSTQTRETQQAQAELAECLSVQSLGSSARSTAESAEWNSATDQAETHPATEILLHQAESGSSGAAEKRLVTFLLKTRMLEPVVLEGQTGFRLRVGYLKKRGLITIKPAAIHPALADLMALSLSPDFFQYIDVSQEKVRFSKNAHTRVSDYANLAFRLRYLLQQPSFIEHLKNCSGYSKANLDQATAFDQGLAEAKALLEQNFAHVMKELSPDSGGDTFVDVVANGVERMRIILTSPLTKIRDNLRQFDEHVAASKAESNPWLLAQNSDLSLEALLNWREDHLQPFSDPLFSNQSLAARAERQRKVREDLSFTTLRHPHSGLAIQLALWTTALSSSIRLPFE